MSNVHQFVEDTFNSINSIKPAQAPYFFNTQVQAKYLQSQANNATICAFNCKPLYLITSLFILLSINIYTLIQFKKTNNTSNQSTEISSIESFATTYHLNSFSFY